ncbi:endonuclease NucS domain-containing protein [Undibacterium sp. Ji49W]|uniref:endonuclease NucS domain-containing protein n=1 Tax=Undibacterium sp. Ji49W TaxID=3413040 RepID=UPI003BF42B25
MKRFNVVISKADGVEMYPMRDWLRKNPEYIPEGYNLEQHNSWQLRGALKRTGWTVQEMEDEVRLIMPNTQNDSSSIETVLGEEADSVNSEETETAFGLEYQLRDFIAQNLTSILVQGKRLSLYVDENGRNGVEYPTAVGPIDILATDAEGTFVVLELKRARSPDYTIGQLSRYMGWIKQTIGKNREVHGVIVAKQISDNLKYAISVIPNVSLFEYEVTFKLIPANDLVGASTIL